MRETPMDLLEALKGRMGGGRPGRGATRPALILLLVGAVPLILSACSSSSASGSGTSTTKPSGKASEAAYTSCLKKHGVTLPNFGNSTPGSGAPPAEGGTRPTFTPGSGSFPGGTPGSGGGFRNNPKFLKAATACKSLRPSGGFGGGFGRGGAGGLNSTAFAAYRNCLKLHGVTLPTPGARAGAGSTPPTTFNQSSSTFQAANQACAALRPTGTSSSTTTTTG
jgi:hypothetical protein